MTAPTSTSAPSRSSADEAALLGVEAGAPAFLFRRVTRREGGRVLESARSLYRGDRYEIQIRQEPGEARACT